MIHRFLIVILACSITGSVQGRPPGLKPISAYYAGIPLHKGNYYLFVDAFKPDSAILYFRQRKNIESTYDSSFVFKVKGGSILSKKKQWNDFVRDEALNRQLIQNMIALNDAVYFRIFYRNATGQVYKYQDISIRGIKVKEVVLTDFTNLSLEIQKFYESGTVSNRTQYFVGSRDSLDRSRFDSLWYDVRPKLVKSGRDDIYYANQNLRLSRIYENGKLKDTTYTEFFSNNNPKRIYATRKGLLDGRSRSFDKVGKLEEELLFENGKIVKTLLPTSRYDSTKKAFLFGLDKYDATVMPEKKMGVKNRWQNLVGCVNDVSLLQSVLVTSAGFNPRNISKLTDDEATKDKMVAAFSSFSKGLKKGDIVFVHFSGHGDIARNLTDSLKKYEGLYIPCRDINYGSDTSYANANCIFQYQVENFFNAIKKQIGRSGQLIISLDVSHSGELLSYGKTDTTAKIEDISSRGESNNILFNLVRDESTPVVVYSGTSSEEYGYEARDNDGKPVGAYTQAFAMTFTSSFVINSAELYDEITNFLKIKGTPQTPGYLASETQFLFERSESGTEKEVAGAVLPVLKASGQSFLLSVGISDYPGKNNTKLRFNNCEADARAYAGFFEKQFDAIQDDKNKKKLNASLLVNKDATKDNILTAINNAISNSKPDDYFIFNFSGYCKPLKDTAGKQVTYFVPYGLTNISDTADIRKNGIPLSQLKDLFQLIPANNQLFITEAGATDDFQKEFIQALIETSPTIASLSNKNRIFIVPKGSGLDKFTCNTMSQEHGPINYCVTNLSDELNVFGLFEGGIYADAVEFAFNKTEIDCDYFRTDYFDIFFERDFISSLRYFLPEDVMKSRGAKVIAKDQATIAASISKKYALVIGTNVYSGKPDWDDLEGVPELDANDIAQELKTNYGFIPILLINKPSDSIYESILRLSKALQPNDQLMIYVAGHGAYDERLFDDGFIVCANSKPEKEDPYRNSYIQYSKLSRMINKLPSRQILMVLDVCFGATFDERVARGKSRSKSTEYTDLSAENYLAEKLKVKTRLYLTSGGVKEVPNGYKGNHSPFAQRFLQCLQTKGGSAKIITATDFFQFVKMLPSGPRIGSFGDDELGSEFIMLAK